jgi:hypothetical protein
MGLKINIRGITESLAKYISTLASGINVTKDAFSTFVNQNKFELKFNAQSIYLSEYLNQVFDSTLKRIYIINDATLFENYFFRTSESIAADEQLYLYRTSETITSDEQVYLDKGGIPTGINFQVAVPIALSSLVTNDVFLASVSKYKLPDKTFEVITY